MRTFGRKKLVAALSIALGAALLDPSSALAQLSTATIKGNITSAGQPAKAGTTVVAVNKATGAAYRGTSLADGSYVIPGLAPGSYELRVEGPAGMAKTGTVEVHVGETASVDLALPAVAARESIVVTSTLQRKDVRTSEVATVVPQKMIEALPQATHNFLSSADLAPGVAFVTDQSGNTRLQSGAQSHDNINVFIDGVGQKNNVLRGGLTGQDSSRGNPFPQSAIEEYKVVTQNYKAEYEQVSSAAITAITRSGTNELHGDAYVDYTSTDMRSKTKFEKERERAGVPLPDSNKSEYGFSLGGPIKQDQMHFFLAYDGKQIEDSRQVVPRNLNLLPANAGIVPGLIAAQGSTVDKFTEHLFFGKVDVQLEGDQRLSASFKVRRESDKVAENRDLSAPGNDKDRSNEETRFDVKHEWSNARWLSEARIGFEDAEWNPHSSASSPFIKYKVSTSSTVQTLGSSQDVIFVGGSPDAQDRAQKGTYVSEDLTYTGLPGHVIKGGGKYKWMKYDLSGTAFSVDTVEVLIDRITGLPYYNGTNCTGTNVTNNGANSDQCNIRRAVPGASANFDNGQLGLYIQDDWAVNPRLELNLGVRWDYESNMLNNDYVTPADRVAALRGLDVPRYGIAPPAGQTYAQSLARGGININDYISNGSSRKPYKEAFAPRLGASYDLTGNRLTVLYGGWGRSYDRTMANHALDELQKNQQAGGEIWLIRNDFKMPYADQYTIGVRQAIRQWNGEIALTRVDAKHQFQWFSGNRDANGGYANQSPIDPLWGGPNGYGSLILGDFVGESRTNMVLGKLEKPWTRASGWGVNIAYTYSDAKTKHRDWNDDIFDWTYGKPGARPWNRSILVDEHRLVAAGVLDRWMPRGLQLAGKATWASGIPRRITSCAAGWDRCVNVEGDAPSFTQVDVGAVYRFGLMKYNFAVRADILNVFNRTNYGAFDDWGGGPVPAGAPRNAVGGDNLNLGTPTGVRGDPRTYKVTLSFSF